VGQGLPVAPTGPSDRFGSSLCENSNGRPRLMNLGWFSAVFGQYGLGGA